VKAGSKY